MAAREPITFRKPPVTSAAPDTLVPFNVEAEEAVLGSLMCDAEAIARVASFLKPEHFHVETNRWIYEAALALFERRDPLDYLTLGDELDRRGQLWTSDGRNLLTGLFNAVPTSVHIEHYGRIVERTAMNRTVIATGWEMSRLGYDESLSTNELIERAQSMVLALKPSADRGLLPASDGILEWSRLQDAGYEPGLKTGLGNFDRRTGGLKPGRLYVVAGGTGEGKSVFLKDAAVTFAKRGDKVGFFTLEMSRVEVLQRAAAGEMGIEYRRVEEGTLSTEEHSRILHAQTWLYDAPLLIDDSGSLTPTELVVKVQHEHLRAPFKLIVVDYLQLMSVPGERNRVQEVSAIARALKSLARDLNVPVLTASQISRAADDYTEPSLRHLRESGDVGNSADVVMFLWSDKATPDPAKPRVINATIAKQRGGPRGKFQLMFNAPSVRFFDVAEEGKP